MSIFNKFSSPSRHSATIPIVPSSPTTQRKAYAWLSGHHHYSGIRGYIKFTELDDMHLSLLVECWGLPTDCNLVLHLPHTPSLYQFTTKTGYLHFSCNRVKCSLASILNDMLTIQLIDASQTVGSGLIRSAS
jgi:hypothetical protein